MIVIDGVCMTVKTDIFCLLRTIKNIYQFDGFGDSLRDKIRGKFLELGLPWVSSPYHPVSNGMSHVMIGPCMDV